jgi:hypothetical protein
MAKRHCPTRARGRPRPGAQPFELYAARRQAEQLGYLARIEAGEDPILDQAHEARIAFTQCTQRFVDRDDHLGAVGAVGIDRAQRHRRLRTAALVRLAATGMVDDDLAHRARTQGEQVRAIVDGQVGMPGQLDVGLVDECGGRQSRVAAGAQQCAVGDLLEFGIDQRKHAREQARIVVGARRNQLGYIRVGRLAHGLTLPLAPRSQGSRDGVRNATPSRSSTRARRHRRRSETLERIVEDHVRIQFDRTDIAARIAIAIEIDRRSRKC